MGQNNFFNLNALNLYQTIFLLDFISLVLEVYKVDTSGNIVPNSTQAQPK